MGEKIKRDCPICGTTYDADSTRLKHGRQTTCSRRCSYELRADVLRNGQEVQCGNCGKTIYRRLGNLKRPRHGDYFCSRECAYKRRQRVCERPYVILNPPDYSAGIKKAWETRRRNAKPYPDAARRKARARAIEQLQRRGPISKFERKAAEVFRSLGFTIDTSCGLRNANGTFAAVFDIVIPSRRMIVECHGSWFHGERWTWSEPHDVQAKNLRREALKHAAARRLGFDMRLLWEHHFKRDPYGACLSVVR